MHLETLRFLLERQESSHKYDFGHVLVIGGSPGMVGAPFLSAMAALRTGAGLVTIASHANVIDKLEKRVVEVMTLRLPDTTSAAIDVIQDFISERKVNVVVLGPGQDQNFAKVALQLVPKLQIPVILDAGALTSFAGKLDVLAQAGITNDIILTPHAGEYKKLTGNEGSDGLDEFAGAHNVTVVYKGHPTLVAHADGTIYENQTGNPGLATAGTGDVLSGIIAGLMAQGVKAAQAADAGVYLHGLAGDRAAEAKTQPGMIASDVITAIPLAWYSLVR